jgi:hypothetical protein
MQNILSIRAAAIASALWLPSFLLVFARADNPSNTFDIFYTPTNNESVNAGSNFDILWAPSPPTGRVTIILMQGSSEMNQQLGPTVVCEFVETLFS